MAADTGGGADADDAAAAPPAACCFGGMAGGWSNTLESGYVWLCVCERRVGCVARDTDGNSGQWGRASVSAPYISSASPQPHCRLTRDNDPQKQRKQVTRAGPKKGLSLGGGVGNTEVKDVSIVPMAINHTGTTVPLRIILFECCSIDCCTNFSGRSDFVFFFFLSSATSASAAAARFPVQCQCGWVKVCTSAHRVGVHRDRWHTRALDPR